MNRRLTAFLVLWIGGGFGYATYATASYTGLFRWFADFELDLFGAYDEKLTFFAVALVVIGFAGFIVFTAAWVIERQWGTAPAVAKIGVPAGIGLNTPIPKAHARAFLVGGLVAIVVAGGAGLVGYRKLQEPVIFEPLDLADGIAPRTSHVELIGLAVLSMQVQVKEHLSTTAYIPLLPPHWRRGDPVVYFLKRYSDERAPR